VVTGPVLPVFTSLIAIVFAALLSLAARVLPLSLALTTIFLPLTLSVSHIEAIAVGHPILQIGSAVSARRREVLNPISAPQT
jgi:hypothetical protein